MFSLSPLSFSLEKQLNNTDELFESFPWKFENFNENSFLLETHQKERKKAGKKTKEAIVSSNEQPPQLFLYNWKRKINDCEQTGREYDGGGGGGGRRRASSF